MPARHEQLREFDRSREGDEPQGEVAPSLHIPESEGQAEQQMDQEMLRDVTCCRDRTKGRRTQGEKCDRGEQQKAHQSCRRLDRRRSHVECPGASIGRPSNEILVPLRVNQKTQRLMASSDAHCTVYW